MKPLCSCEEPEGAEPVRSRGRRNNGKGPKKPRQRGLGVEQLERLRIASGGVPIPTLHDHHHHLLQCHPAPPMFGSVPVRYGAPAPPSPNYHHAHGGFHQYCPHQQQQQQVIGGTTGLNVLGGGGDHCSVTGGVAAAGWVVPNQHNNRVGPYGSGPPTLFSPMENSKELSSMPNVHSDQSLDLCLKKTRLNEDNVSNAIWRERPSEAWPNVHDFIEFVNGDFYNKKLAKHIDAASASATPNPDECAEVVAVHRRGNSESSRVFMEYEFFPAGKDHGSRGTTSKELEFPTNMQGSVSVGGGSSEASSIITTVTASAYYGDTASNSVDLSLKL